MSAGDPKADLAYERQYEHQQTYHVIPEVIKNFLQYFHKTISDLIDQKVYELQANRVSSESIEQKIYEIQDVYENRLDPETSGNALQFFVVFFLSIVQNSQLISASFPYFTWFFSI